MVIIYPVILTKTGDKKDTYLVEIPDLGGLTEGYGLANALQMARDYIGGVCCDMKDEDIPEASDPTKIDIHKSEFSDGENTIVTLVDLDLDRYRKKMMNRSIRRNVSIPEWLDRAAKREHLNVSGALREALMEKLHLQM